MDRYKGSFEALVQQLVVPAFVLGPDGSVAVWNLACESLTGMLASEVVGTKEHWRAFYAEPRPVLADLVLTGRLDRMNQLYVTNDNSAALYGGVHAENWCVMPLRGVNRYLSIDVGLIHDENGAVVGAIETLRDWTDWKQAELNLRLHASIFEHAPEGIIITDAKGTIISVNKAFTALTGYESTEAIGRNPRLLQSGMHDKTFYKELWGTLISTGKWSGEMWNRKKSGEIFPENSSIWALWGDDGKIANFFSIFNDISTVKRAQERLEDMAVHDALTGLPNRIALSTFLQKAIASANRHKKLLAVCFLDLDGFKPINDSHGHVAGDKVLVEIAGRLNNSVRSNDFVARLGGDEFVLLLSDFSTVDEIETAVIRILEEVALPISLDENETQVSVSGSLGITVYPLDEVDSDTLIRHADQAMYDAKNMGRNNWKMFDTRIHAEISVARELFNQVREGLANKEFCLFYQPKINMRSGCIEGAEALIRWLHPEKGLIPPAGFLPQIEKTPLIVEVGEWVIEEALARMSIWSKQGLDLKVSVNVAARQFQHIDFVPRLRRILAMYPEVSPNKLELEVLESAAITDIEGVRSVVVACREMGVGLALDDFGTGYSTLTHLKRLPANTLKIDASFVRHILDDKEDLAIVEGIVGLASVFRMTVIAEGVETIEQGILLMRVGCNFAQGYCIARPMPAADIPAWCAAYELPDDWRFWAQHQQWDRTHLPLVLAEYDHLKWVQQIVASLDDSQSEPPRKEIEDPHACRFGQWYDHEGLQAFGQKRHFKKIGPLHRSIHETGARMVRLHAEGKLDEARELVPKLVHLKDQIVVLLARLHGELMIVRSRSGKGSEPSAHSQDTRANLPAS
jgi:diguanylate cyclase (GGDEF)-like protein/PAS domain S-box-containing protein